jgi:hypothetical protein
MKLVNLQVLHTDGTYTYYQINNRGWRIDVPSRLLVVGRGLERTIVPLDTVRNVSFEVTETPDPAPEEDPGPDRVRMSGPTPLILANHTRPVAL